VKEPYITPLANKGFLHLARQYGEPMKPANCRSARQTLASSVIFQRLHPHDGIIWLDGGTHDVTWVDENLINDRATGRHPQKAF